VHLVFYRTEEIKRFLIAIVLSSVPYLVLWAPILLTPITNSAEGAAWLKKPGWSMLGDLLFNYGGAMWLVVPLLLYLRWRGRSEAASGSVKPGVRSLVLLLLVITLSTPLFLSAIKPIFNSRLAIVGLHLFALSIGAFVGRGANYLLPIAVLVLTVTFLPIVHPVSAPCDNRETAAYLSRTASND